MKKLVKELLVVIVAICATVGLFAFAGMPQWFNNFFGFGTVPNAGLNGLLNNGGLNPAGGNPLAPVPPAGGNIPGGAGLVPPAGGVGGGVVGVAPGGAVAGAPQMAVTVWIAKNSILPNQTNIPVGASVTWKNVSPFARKLESVVPGLLSSPVIPSGGSWTNTFTAVGPIKYRAMGVGNPAQIPINASLTVN